MSLAKKTDLSSLSSSQLYQKCLEKHIAVEETRKEMQVLDFEINYLEDKPKLKEEEMRTKLLEWLKVTEIRASNLFNKHTLLLAKKTGLEFMEEQKREAEAEAEARANAEEGKGGGKAGY